VTATNLASDMIDRMKANFTGVINGDYNKPALTAYTGTGVPGCNTTSGCTSPELATNDRYEWSQRIAQTLPGGVGVVCVDSTPNDAAVDPTPAGPNTCDGAGTTLYVVKIWWYDDRSPANPLGKLKYVYMAFNP
jgi:type IV pilus assembly protein PilV